ncbi:MAG: U32 family peptidase [Eubacteriales bacterium]
MIELLAPAGNYKGFLGAIHAGADAVYLAGNQYGARAYAENFSEEEIVQAITYAHLFGRKVYVTVNTLLKEEELGNLGSYLQPLYHAQLDGVIVQDIGVFLWIQKNFPSLELHCSTQMAITGVYGARRLKNMGASRIVVARELSLREIERIREEVDVEIEMFVHGSMCYAYSGNCLFSSVLGGRSGNRGKCAQPCRLPYELEQVSGTQEYLLSLKDLCLLPQLDSLIKAGVHSLKIEGRMKRPEYTAGVTAIYRKYIDLYENNPTKEFFIETKDLEYISQLYIRSELSKGYYHKHNGSNMVTLEQPSYGVTSQEMLEEIQQKYLEKEWKVPITMQVVLQVGERIQAILHHVTYGRVVVEGAVIQEAQKRPLEEADIRKQMSKVGDTHFEISELVVERKGKCFLPIKDLNELRRNGMIAMEQLILTHGNKHQKRCRGNDTENSLDAVSESLVNDVTIEVTEKNVKQERGKQTLHISVCSLEQLRECSQYDYIGRVYVESDLILRENEVEEYIGNEWLEGSLECYLKMPYILRLRSYEILERLKSMVMQASIQGVLVRNIETLQWLEEIGYEKEIAIDGNVYCFNSEAIAYYKSLGLQIIVPYELNQNEIRKLPFEGESYYCYGKIPMMITANCVYQTKNGCTRSENQFVNLVDRYHKKLPVYLNCNYCYNIIYNTVPLSLHQSLVVFSTKYKMQGIMSFTNESREEMKQLIPYFWETFSVEKRTADSVGIVYTKGHLKRGVE